MYTKFFILTALFVLLSSAAISISINKSTAAKTPNKEIMEKNNTSAGKQKKDELPWGVNWPDHTHADDNSHSKHHPHDDDGKEHHFHMNRFDRLRRWRKACCFIANTALVLIHICLLALSFSQTLTYIFAKLIPLH